MCSIFTEKIKRCITSKYFNNFFLDLLEKHPVVQQKDETEALFRETLILILLISATPILLTFTHELELDEVPLCGENRTVSNTQRERGKGTVII